MYLQLAFWSMPRRWREFLAGLLARRGTHSGGDDPPDGNGVRGDPAKAGRGDGSLHGTTASKIRGRFGLGAFLAILASFSATVLLSWPILFSLQLWAFRDRASMMNVEYLVDRHLRLGVDAYYSYGLLPVFAQHYLFFLFGTDYLPLLGLDFVSLVLMAVFWTAIARHFPRKAIWLIVIISLAPTLITVNPGIPYVLVRLSIIFSLVLVLEHRLEWALAVAAIGCLSVPSLPLVLFGLLAFLMVLEWMLSRRRKFLDLVWRLAPAAVTYLLLFAALAWKYGARSAEIAAVPILGRRFYRAAGFGFFTSFAQFLHPRGHNIPYYAEYYVFTPAAWWLLGTVALFAFGAMAVARVVKTESIDARDAFILLCGALQAVLIFVAYGAPDQHVIYDFVLVAGALAGICWLTSGRLQRNLLISFLALGILGQTNQARLTLNAWKKTRESAQDANLYATPAWTSEWSRILDLSRKQRVLLLSYGTGAQDFFATIHTANVWFLRAGELFPSDESRVAKQIDRADIIVEDLDDPTTEIDRNKRIQSELRSVCLTDVEPDFQIWRRNPAHGTICKANTRAL